MRKCTLIKLFLRCFIVQSVMGMRYMQSFGFAFAIYPGLREIFPGGRDLTKVLRRHLSFFHTHAVFFPCILGCILRGEIENAGNEGDTAQLAMTKDILMGPFSALGDGFFRAALLPLAAAVGVILAVEGSLWGPVCLITIYNVPNLWVRIVGFLKGFKQGVGVLITVQQWRLTRYMRWIHIASALMGGVLLALWSHSEVIQNLSAVTGLWTVICSLLLAVVLQLLLSRGFSVIYLLYMAALIVGGVALLTA
jgi:mannose/fructose/N-acetylgalactosamine-specific phosphotransferase system component IID